MSFQNFRLDGVSAQPVQSPAPPAVPYSTPPNPVASGSSPASHVQDGTSRGAHRGPYGSGDMDDGYTLIFESLDAFQVWREKEEEDKIVEFVKGDTHGSKAVPPRFKDHVKLVCARHSRSGRKKYVKKFPERVRKVPSRKIDGKGCPASMSYKTYFDTPEVRVCYVSQHSHEIGPANLPFTRRGRRALAATKPTGTDTSSPLPQASPQPGPPSPQPPQPGPAALQGHVTPPAPVHPQQQPPLPPHPAAFGTPYPHFPSMSMPLPQGLGGALPLPLPPPHMHMPVAGPGGERERMERERWDRMDVLYQSVRANARQFEYPAASVAALESVLVRMYFESPLPAPHAPYAAMQQPVQQAPPQVQGGASGGTIA
ncbi:hypothetical protein BC834DRAFT_27958 [Gloeopeniophorella convolvens]|nr:hypothetical protein BC834DRAFT_27958 [Gloeopeniophorella convolvens]